LGVDCRFESGRRDPRWGWPGSRPESLSQLPSRAGWKTEHYTRIADHAIERPKVDAMLKQSCTLITALALLAAAAPADAQGRRGGAAIALHHGQHGHHGHWRSGFWGGIGIGLWPYYGARFAYPGYYGPVVVAPPQEPLDAVVPAAPSAPDPVFLARNGQDAARMESDRQACNRWVATQSPALRDAQVFHRMSLACMQGRGYSVQ
jgi:hypothetical protein